MNQLPDLGKGCYLWRPKNLYNGDVQSIIRKFVEAKVQHVAIKLTNGTYRYDDVMPVILAMRHVGIVVGAWSYIYLAYNPWGEANVASQALRDIRPAYYLLDIEGPSTYFKTVQAKILMNKLRQDHPLMPMGLNTFWYPPYHREIPYNEIRSKCDFDAPQIYSRGTDPVKKYELSKMEYAKMSPRLPFGLPAGDMYYEFGIKPRPGDVTMFLTRARNDPEAAGAVMWSADQCETTPDLWAEFAAFEWRSGNSDPLPPVPTEPQPLYAAVVLVDYLRVRSSPAITTTNITTQRLMKGDRVEVWKVENGFSAIAKDLNHWVWSPYLSKL